MTRNEASEIASDIRARDRQHHLHLLVQVFIRDDETSAVRLEHWTGSRTFCDAAEIRHWINEYEDAMLAGRAVN